MLLKLVYELIAKLVCLIRVGRYRYSLLRLIVGFFSAHIEAVRCTSTALLAPNLLPFIIALVIGVEH